MSNLVKTTRSDGTDSSSGGSRAGVAPEPAGDPDARTGSGSALRQCSTYREFWPLYLRLHATPGCRVMHYAGTGAALVGIGLFAATGQVALLAAGIVGAYGLAWIGHFLFEGNRPATFSRPLWSLWSDIRMAWLALSGRLGAELERIDETSSGGTA